MTLTELTVRFLSRCTCLALVLFSGAFMVGSCTAQPDDKLILLPPELQRTATVNELKDTFCMGCRDVVLQPPSSSNREFSFCQQLCRTDNLIHNVQCWKYRGSPHRPTQCMEGQSPVCMYQDAIVCGYEDGSGSCLYHSEGPSPFCICRDESEVWSSEPEESCDLETSDSDVDPDRVPIAPDPPTSGDVPAGQINVPAVVLGCVLSVVVLCVSVGVGVWCVLRRRSQSDSSRENSKAPDSPHMNLSENAHHGVQSSEDLVPDSHEYAYVDANYEPTNHETGEPESDCHTSPEDHYYCKVDKDPVEGSDRYVNHGLQGTPQKESPTTVAPSDPEYFVLEKEDLGEGSWEGSTLVSPEKEDDGDYVQTTVPPIQISGYEVAVVSPAVTEDLESSQYDHLDRATHKRPSEGALPGQENNLETDDDYNHISRD